MYWQMAALGGQVTMQTAAANRIGDWQAAIEGGCELGARSIELPAGYTEWPAADLTALSAGVAAGCP